MEKRKVYTRDGMLSTIEKHFKENGYVTKHFSEDFLPARVPLYCSKENEEIVVEITTEENISKEDFFPEQTIDNIDFYAASSVIFYQHYFIKAKIFYAYPDYANGGDNFEKFKNICEKRGIGLLKTSKNNVELLVDAKPLFQEICNQLQISEVNIRTKLEYHLRNFLHYFVYYPEPEFKRRSISSRPVKNKENISFVLIDKLLELKNISYRETLIELANTYRKKALNDYEIAELCIKDLWKNYIGIKYPTIQIRVENILQRNEKYREHFLHQFQVFLIGAYFLDKKYNEISEKYNEEYDCKIEVVWLAASTFHDFNYSLQFYETWLIQYFKDALVIKNDQTKQKINILNLDAAMVRDELFDKLSEICLQFKGSIKDKQRKKLLRFFYEKTVNDRNHGVLSAISLLKLFDDNDDNIINKNGILQAALAIGCHDEDIWEALCGCQGFIRSSQKSKDCFEYCTRKHLLWPSKIIRIFQEHLDSTPICCEKWEIEVMNEKMLKKIKFQNYPILFLLMFCDSIQDEGRVKSVEEDNSTYIDEIITTQNKNPSITVKLKSNEYDKKSNEIQRLAWCLEDKKFKIYINGNCFSMDGHGGG